MGSILGGGDSGGGGGLGGLLDPLGLFKGGGGGGLGGILGNLPDPLHLFNKGQPQTPMGQQAQQPGQGPVNFAPQPGQQSGVSFNPSQMLYSPMGPGGFKIGGGG